VIQESRKSPPSQALWAGGPPQAAGLWATQKGLSIGTCGRPVGGSGAKRSRPAAPIRPWAVHGAPARPAVHSALVTPRITAPWGPNRQSVTLGATRQNFRTIPARVSGLHTPGRSRHPPASRTARGPEAAAGPSRVGPDGFPAPQRRPPTPGDPAVGRRLTLPEPCGRLESGGPGPPPSTARSDGRAPEGGACPTEAVRARPPLSYRRVMQEGQGRERSTT
jgi:hypothetical protein